MKRHHHIPRPCPCEGSCQKCDGMIKPISEFEFPRVFKRRKYCCRWCPVQTERKKGYRKEPKPVELNALGRFIGGET